MKQLTEKEAENFLEKKGFNIVNRKLIKKENELDRNNIPFPIVMKASGKNINHKGILGAVITNIKNREEAKNSFRKLKKIKDCQEIMVQKQLNGEELILGLKNTPEFGLVILLGKGGTNVEKEKDISFRVIPITKQDAQKMFRELKNSKKLKDKINETLLIKNLLKLSKLANTHKTKINELDINPLIINKTQATIVDARIIFK
jgi:succinyl-CoA synthetase beta subunit